jgi:hypothetical protein
VVEVSGGYGSCMTINEHAGCHKRFEVLDDPGPMTGPFEVVTGR